MERAGTRPVNDSNQRPSQTAGSRGALPRWLTALVGRDELVADLAALCTSNRLVTLTGAGGVGKTRVAVEVAALLAEGGDRAAWFVDLSPVPGAIHVPGAVASAIGLQLGTGEAVDQLVDELSRRPGLLVLDNCEHVVHSAAALAEQIVARTPSHVLATSRERLNVDGEVERVVSPLAVSGPDPHARRLFVERAGALDLGPNAAESAAHRVIDELCARLDGLPLAIELAAARVKVMTPADLLDRIDDRFRLLSAPGRGSGEGRDRALKATIDWSYDLLPEAERECLQRLGVFVGTFDADAAAAVCERDAYEVLDLLDALVGKSMVAVDAGGRSRRFRLLESMRAYALDRLAADGRLDGARDAHAAWYRALVAAPKPWFMPAAAVTADQALDWPNVRAAFDRLAERRRWQEASQIAGGCAGLVCDQGYGWAAVHMVDLCLQHAADVDDEVSDTVRITSMLIGMTTADWARHERSLAELAESPDTTIRATATAQRALVWLVGAPSAADRFVDEALSIAEAPGVPATATVVPRLMDGARRMLSGDVHGAIGVLESVRDTCLALQAKNVFYAWACDAIAVGHLVLDRPHDALAALERDAIPSLFDRRNLLEAVALADLGRPDEAARLLSEQTSTHVARRVAGHANDTAVAMAALAIARGRRDGAVRLLTASSPRHINMYPLALALARRVDAEEVVRARWLARAESVPNGRDGIGEADDAIEAESGLLAVRPDGSATTQADGDGRPERGPASFLTPREAQILSLVADGLANKQIARRLGVSEKTVKNHLSNVFVKIGVSDRTQAALYAVRNGLASAATPPPSPD